VLDTILTSDAVGFEEERLNITDLVLPGLHATCGADRSPAVDLPVILERQITHTFGHEELVPQTTHITLGVAAGTRIAFAVRPAGEEPAFFGT
jgi:hypothetical protein